MAKVAPAVEGKDPSIDEEALFLMVMHEMILAGLVH